MDRLNGSASLMIVSDLDCTMVDHDDTENLALLRFNALWEAYYRHDSLLVFSTGRSPTIYKQLRKEKPLLTPDITVLSVGTEIMYGESMIPDSDWEQLLNKNWNRNIVTEETAKYPELSLQQDVKIIYSGGIALDVLPQGAGKGQALAYLIKKFQTYGKPPLCTLVCGDSGNDAELFSVPKVYGVMVSNAQEELLEWHAENAKSNPNIIHASERCAAAIIQAIGYFHLGPSISPRDVSDFSECKEGSFNPGHEVVTFYSFYERWRRAEVQKTERSMQKLRLSFYPLGIIVHPSGFEQPLHQYIDGVQRSYGDKQGTQFRVWLDRVSSAQIGVDIWLVKFDKWELSGEEQECCLTTVLLRSKLLHECNLNLPLTKNGDDKLTTFRQLFTLLEGGIMVQWRLSGTL
ncbi:sucrose-phosphatase 2-like isoform X5 [Rhododendron vialii]|uniref:sucrose-phosphatase 2-like isoform X5 n=1 Tax=Rhododendron vialii TaxID=182163 RepID=UPI00265F067C|nr:sucrose-phosphatase 2-like isoform X5 [Rhododendron vialii]